jgi:hypothetical protein
MKHLFIFFSLLSSTNAFALSESNIIIGRDDGGAGALRDDLYVWNAVKSGSNIAIPMSEAVADYLRNFDFKMDVRYTCRGKIYGAQIYSLSDCQPAKKIDHAE